MFLRPVNTYLVGGSIAAGRLEMRSGVTRRDFLAGAGRVSAGVLAATCVTRPVLADGHPTWLASCRDVIVRSTRQKNCWAALHAIGAEGVEIEVAADLSLPSLFHPTVKYTVANAAGIEQLAADAKAAEQQITAFCMHNQFATRPAEEVENCTRLAGAAQSLGISTIRLDVVPGGLARPAFFKLSIAALKKIIAATESTGVRFAVENHSNTTNDPAFLHPVLDQVGSKRLGVTLDIGNFYWFGHPLSKVYELCETFAPYVFHTHCKNIRYPAAERQRRRPMGWEYAEYARPVDQGDIDYVRVATILSKVGYHNDFCVENEFLNQLSPVAACRTLAREIQFLKQVRNKVSA